MKKTFVALCVIIFVSFALGNEENWPPAENVGFDIFEIPPEDMINLDVDFVDRRKREVDDDAESPLMGNINEIDWQSLESFLETNSVSDRRKREVGK